MSITSTARATTAERPVRQPDTVVAYDVMREAANRLIASHVATSSFNGGPVAHESVLERINEIADRADAVPAGDLGAIHEAAAQFAAERRDVDAA